MNVAPKNLSVPEDWNVMRSLATLVFWCWKCQWSNASFYYYTRDLRQAGASEQIKKIQVFLHCNQMSSFSESHSM
jgi:hypothetical protein